MKKLMASAVLIFVLNASYAQISKGQWLVGGSGSASFIDQGIFKGTNFDLSPAGGYFFMDKLAGGLRLNYRKEILKESGVRIINNNYYGLLPFVRYYILPQAKKINPFLEASYSILLLRSRGTTNEVFKETILGYTTSGGASFFIHPKIALEAFVSYDFDKPMKYERDETKAVKGNVGFQIHL